jgi:hypothetical protein
MTESKLFAHDNFGLVQKLFFGRDGRSQHKARYPTACWPTFEEAVERSSLSLVSNPWVFGRRRHGMSVWRPRSLNCKCTGREPTALTEPSNVYSLVCILPATMAGPTGMILNVIPGFHVLKPEN